MGAIEKLNGDPDANCSSLVIDLIRSGAAIPRGTYHCREPIYVSGKNVIGDGCKLVFHVDNTDWFFCLANLSGGVLSGVSISGDGTAGDPIGPTALLTKKYAHGLCLREITGSVISNFRIEHIPCQGINGSGLSDVHICNGSVEHTGRDGVALLDSKVTPLIRTIVSGVRVENTGDDGFAFWCGYNNPSFGMSVGNALVRCFYTKNTKHQNNMGVGVRIASAYRANVIECDIDGTAKSGIELCQSGDTSSAASAFIVNTRIANVGIYDGVWHQNQPKQPVSVRGMSQAFVVEGDKLSVNRSRR